MKKINFPKSSFENATLEYNSSFKEKFNDDMNKIQKYLDNTVVINLMQYVSYKTGTQEKSIPIATTVGSGEVIINVPYAEYQAYSKKIKKRVGKRGTQPWERMVAEKKKTIYKELQEYARRLGNG